MRQSKLAKNSQRFLERPVYTPGKLNEGRNPALSIFKGRFLKY